MLLFRYKHKQSPTQRKVYASYKSEKVKLNEPVRHIHTHTHAYMHEALLDFLVTKIR